MGNDSGRSGPSCSAGYVSFPSSTLRNDVSLCSVAGPAPTMSNTSHPFTVNASAISDRWHRYGTASAHIVAVASARANPINSFNPSANSAVAM
jgi:hypothetical protein